MNPFLDQVQIDEDPFCDWDEDTKQEVEDFYDDLAEGLPLDSSYEF
jgi:hypothetical protein